MIKTIYIAIHINIDNLCCGGWFSVAYSCVKSLTRDRQCYFRIEGTFRQQLWGHSLRFGGGRKINVAFMYVLYSLPWRPHSLLGSHVFASDLLVFVQVLIIGPSCKIWHQHFARKHQIRSHFRFETLAKIRHLPF